jgi:oxidoreductase domain protein
VRGGRLGVPKRLVWIITNWYRTQAYYDSGDWRATWSGEGGGVLLNQAPHNLDIWQWIFGMPARVRAFCTTGKYHHIEVEDDATIYAEYDSGATAAFITSTGECPGTNRLEISGDRGKLLIEDGRLRFWELAEPERAFCFSSREGFVMPEAREWTMQPDAPETAHTGILRNFADAVLHGAPLLAPGEEGIHQVALTNAAYLSSWTDDWVSLPLDAAAYEKQLRARIARSAKKASDTAGEAPSGQYNPRWNIRW